MENCIFCRIANGEIPSSTIYEDEDVRVILDINPASKGHALVLPKAHFKSFLEYPANKLGDIFAVAQKIALAQEKGLKCDGVNILANCNEAAGQTVDHFHIHVIPRYFNKDLDGFIQGQEGIAPVDREEVLQSIQEAL